MPPVRPPYTGVDELPKPTGVPRFVFIVGVVLIFVAGGLGAIVATRPKADEMTIGDPTSHSSAQIPGGGSTPGTPGASDSAGPSASASAKPSTTPKAGARTTGPTSGGGGGGTVGPPVTDPNARGCQRTPSSCGLPDSTNTGVPAGTTLTKVSGDVHITTAGSTYSGKDVSGCVFVEANNVTVKNIRVNCPANWAVRNSNNTGLVVQDSELICGPNGYTGINGTFTARRVNIHGCENGFQPGDGTLVEDSYIWDLNTANNNHPDGAELDQGAHNITFRHNTILAPITNSAIIMWDGGDPQNSNITIQDNLLAGGGFTLYCPRNNASNITVTNNRFGPSNFGATSSCTPGHVTTWSGNIDDVDGSTIPGK